MDKKRKFKVIIIACVIIIIVISTFLYFNSPSHVINSYIQAYNNENYDRMVRMEYDYGEYEIVNIHSDASNPLNHSQVNLIYKGNGESYIEEYCNRPNEELKRISYIYVYELNNFYIPSWYSSNIIVVGKVGMINKIVASPFYSLIPR